jgi:hypothetical protein
MAPERSFINTTPDLFDYLGWWTYLAVLGGPRVLLSDLAVPRLYGDGADHRVLLETRGLGEPRPARRALEVAGLPRRRDAKGSEPPLNVDDDSLGRPAFEPAIVASTG